MTTLGPDGELLADYTARKSEPAFDALVARHIRMVFATAIRQVGESHLAEEVTQNTFVALARKAPRLHGHQTLAGWLHRTALLEAKACIRKELRRRRREEAAAALASAECEGHSPSEQLVPLLDEALLDLRDSDRQALILRFLEGCSLRDVGHALGVDEDAARKRVSRALERVAHFFRQRGFAIPSGTAALVSVLSVESAQAVPSGLAAATSQAALAAALSCSPLTLAGINLMALTKTQTALVALLIAGTPLAWQWRAQARVDQAREMIAVDLARTEGLLGELETRSQEQREAARRVEIARLNAEIRLGERQNQLSNRAPTPVYQWNDAEPRARVPKSFLAGLSLSAVRGRNGDLDPKMIDALQLNDLEVGRLRDSLSQFLERYDALQASRMTEVAPRDNELEDHAPEDVRVFEFPYEPDSLGELREGLFAELRETLGEERFPIFQKGLQNWMPLNDEETGISSTMAVVKGDHRYVFFRPEPGSDMISWQLKVEERAKLSMSMDLSGVTKTFPAYLIHQIQDWIEEAKPWPGENIR